MPTDLSDLTDFDYIDRARPRRRRRGCLTRFFLVVILLLVGIITHRLWLPALARVLIVDQTPTEASAILVLGGGSSSRLDRALELYQAGQAPLVITSGESPRLPDFEQTFAELAADYLVRRGVPPDVISMMKDTTSTYEEAENSLRLAQDQGFTSFLVVTDDYHTRRSSLVFRRVYRDSNVRLIFVAARSDWFNPDAWWTEERSLLAVFGEYEKLLHHLLKGYLT